MNQILFSKYENAKNIEKNNKKVFKLLFYISIILIFCCSAYFLYSSHITSKKERLSKNLINNFNLERLYAEKENSINFLLDEIYRLRDEIELLKGPTLSNGIIDLYFEEENSDENVSFYYLTISGQRQKIGRIDIRWYAFDYMFGNVGAELDKNYRGNRYALQSLELLKDVMIDRGLTKPIFTARPDNIPSIKTIENFGGKLIQEANEEQFWNTYEVDLLENNVPRKH